MKNLKFYFKFFLLGYIVLSGSLIYSLQQWLVKPNNFFYTKESEGSWSTEKSFDDASSGFKVKINSSCAKDIYNQLEENFSKTLNQEYAQGLNNIEYRTLDFNRFLKNKTTDLEFQVSEINYASRFKWLKDNYITYDDPTLNSGTRFSFRNKCLYDKECLLSDSIDYLFIKLGIKYFLDASQEDFLKKNCIDSQKLFFKITPKYNWGRSDTYYRNGVSIWLNIWYNLLGLIILFLSTSVLCLSIINKKSK